MLSRIKLRTFNRNGTEMVDMRSLNELGDLSEHGIFIEKDEVPQFINKLQETVKNHDNEEKRIVTMTKKLEDFWTQGYKN